MPAVYSRDLIAERDRKNKMNSSIIKGWNVHYQTMQEADDAQLLKQIKLEREKAEQAERMTQAEPEPELQEEEKKPELSEDAYNAKTGSYSGHYGQEPVHDEGAKRQIDAILSEKTDAFDAALSELKEQNVSGQPAEEQ